MAKTKHLQTKQEKLQEILTEEYIQWLMSYWRSPLGRRYAKLREEYEELLAKKCEKDGKRYRLGNDVRLMECDFLGEKTPEEAEAMLRALRFNRLDVVTNRLNTGQIEYYCRNLSAKIFDTKAYLKRGKKKWSKLGSADPDTCRGTGRHRGGYAGPSEP